MRTVESVYLSVFLFTVSTSEVSRQDDLTRKARTILRSEFMTPPEMAISQGYPAETHQVLTEDGYVLGIHRIPYGKRNFGSGKRPVIILQHCLLCSSADWLLNYPEKALGYILADNGYDVWMTNGRGNTYSKKHVKLSPKSKEFWDFSWHEIAKYDLPASIDYILNQTGSSKLSYVGFSLGSTIFYPMMSLRPSYNDKVKVAAMLGPAAYQTHSEGTAFTFSPFVNTIEKLTNTLGIYELLPQGEIQNKLATTLCSRRNSFLNELCRALYSTFIDINDNLVNQEFLPQIFSHMPAGGSVKTFLHLLQIKNADRYQQYSYGRHGNLQVYGTPKPPLYDISKTKVPIGLFFAREDKYVTVKDVKRLANELPNLALQYEITVPKFSHFDFLWAKRADKILYRDVLKFLDSYL